MEYISLRGGACDDCTIAIANNDYTGMSEQRAQEVRSSIHQSYRGRDLVIGEEMGFSHQVCAICSGLPGNRHEVGYLK